MENSENDPKPKINLFENIALTFSGGGYCASSYSLGTLSYFNHVMFKGKPLLENVKGLSTASGGTLTGATYAYYKCKGNDFESFYKQFYNVLNEDKLLGIALKKLDSNETWVNTHKKRSLINAFALAYSELLTDGTFKDLKDHKSHLEDICFNATDFSFGLAFRFQTTGDFGNYKLKNSNLTKLSEEMKIADAIASSSCFPTGFEPLVMPDDFISNQDSDVYVALKNQEYFKKGIGIMDGGIVDNQGIGSIMNADARRKDKFDLIMVCDVGSYFMDPWKPSKIKINPESKGLTPKTLFNKIIKKLKSAWWIFIPLVLTIALIFLGIRYQPGTGFFIAGGATGLLTILAVICKIYIHKFEKKVMQLWNWAMDMLPGSIKEKLPFLENLRLKLIQRMLEERGTSALIMITDVFMKQLRRLNYNLFYTDNNLNHRRITSLIYELTEAQYKRFESDEKGYNQSLKKVEDKLRHYANPSDKIYTAAKIASEMATTLWFTEKDKEVHRLKNLISCGQFTACFNLLKYCLDLKEADVQVDKTILNKMIDTFQADWEKFTDNPYWLFEELK
ncbi:MAG: patatin-like phospholipase family protein [Prolixibacteraceae bacterium]|nr:patatin-like phospholipase family protein [Prolixibacteraceae bacterium]